MARIEAEELSVRALRAAVAVARELGLAVTDPEILRDRGNLIVHLRPSPVVARVATLSQALRPDLGRLAREVAVARFLAEAGAPVVGPSTEVDPGPHVHDGLSLSFWRYVDDTGSAPDPAEAGRRLRICHEALTGCETTERPLALLDEAEGWLRDLTESGRLAPADAELLAAAARTVRERAESLDLPLQVVHGDAHLGNAIATPDGPLWSDWEDVCLAPREWDLACLLAASRVFGGDPRPDEIASAAYGPCDAGAVEVLIEVRRFQGTMWASLLTEGPLEDNWRLAPLLDWYRL